MIFKKLLVTLIAVGGLVFGAIQLRNVPMENLHHLCGKWG